MLILVHTALTVLVEDRKHHIDHMIGQLHMRHRFRHMLESRLIDGRTGDVIERQRRVHVVDVVEKVEKVQILFVRDTAAGLLEVLLHALQLLRLLLVRVAGIGEHQLGEIRLGDVALGVRTLALELQREDLALQLVLELEELLDRQLLVLQLAEEERVQRRVDALRSCSWMLVRLVWCSIEIAN